MRLFAGADPPTAAFAANNLMTIGVLRALRDLGLAVPRAVSVVGFDDHLLADLLDPPLSVVDRDVENQGAVAMRMLLARLSGDVTGPGRTVRLDTRLIRRSSTTSQAAVMKRRHALRLPEPAEMPSILVIGSMMIDQITYCERVPEEGETLVADRYEQGFGGKGANQAVMAARLGAPVALVGCVGDDDLGRATVANLEANEIDASGVKTIAGCATGVAPIWVDGSGANRILIAPGANDAVDAGTVAGGFASRDDVAVVLAQLETPQAASGEAFRLARQRGAVTILNPAPAAAIDDELLDVTDWLIPNESEYQLLFGAPRTRRRRRRGCRPALWARRHPRRRRCDRQSRLADVDGQRACRRLPSTPRAPATPSSAPSPRASPSDSIPSTRPNSVAWPGRCPCAEPGRNVRFPHVATWRTSSDHHRKGGTMTENHHHRPPAAVADVGARRRRPDRRADDRQRPRRHPRRRIRHDGTGGTHRPQRPARLDRQRRERRRVRRRQQGLLRRGGPQPDADAGRARGDPRADRRVRRRADRAVLGRHDRPRQRRGRRAQDRRRHVAAEPIGGDVVGVQPGARRRRAWRARGSACSRAAMPIYEAFFLKAGVDASQVTIVPVQFDPAPLVAGEVDAFASFQTNQPIALAAEGIETVTWLLADYGYNLYADAFFVTEDTLADPEARDTVVALPAGHPPRLGGRHRRPGGSRPDRRRRVRRRPRPRPGEPDGDARGVRAADPDRRDRRARVCSG